jgi:hypothetical protein
MTIQKILLLLLASLKLALKLVMTLFQAESSFKDLLAELDQALRVLVLIALEVREVEFMIFEQLSAVLKSVRNLLRN